MAGVGQIVYGADYNAVQVKITEVLGSGSPYGPLTANPDYGYNQALLSSTVAVNAQITAAQWNNLANDLNKAYTHQNNTSFPGYATISGIISYANLSLLDGIATGLITNRLTRAAAQASKTQFAATGATRATAWGNGNVTISSTYTVTFASYAEMVYYFNQGGTFNFTGIVGTVATNQDIAWQTAINAMTTAAPTLTPAIFHSNLSTTNYAIYNTNFTYGTDAAAENISINVRLNAAKPTATQLIFTVSFHDTHVVTGSPPASADSVSGGFGYNFYKNTTIGAFTGVQPSSGAVTAFV